MKNKKLIITLSAIGAVLLILIISIIATNNSFVNKEEEVNAQKSNIEVYLQRRADLIPNLVEVVKDYTEYEQSTLTAVTEARAALTKAIDSGDVGAQAEASAQLDAALDVWVNAVTEAYPELKADKQYTALTDELAGSENRIATARKDYNDAVQEYNASIRRFPGSIVAGMFGFEKAELFRASTSAYDAPEVNFD